MKLQNGNYEKVVSFKEEESRKVDELRNIINSKFFLSIIVVFLTSVLFYISQIVISSIGGGEFNITNVLDIIFGVAVELIIPYFFAKGMIKLYMASKKLNKEPLGNSIMTRTFYIRKIYNFCFILLGVLLVLSGLSAISLDPNSALLQNMTGLTEEQVQTYVNTLRGQAPYQFFIGGSYLIFSYGLVTCFKVLFNSIIFDDKNNKAIELIVFSSLIGIFGTLVLLGNVLALVGVKTIFFPRVAIYVTLYNVTLEVINLLSSISISVLSFLVVILLLRIRKVLVTVSGSNNILDNGEVYTVNLDDQNIQ